MPAIDSNRHIRPVLSAPASAVRRALFLLSMPLALGTACVAHAQTSTDSPTDTKAQSALPAVSVSAKAAPVSPEAATFGGGTVAKSTSLGVLGTQQLINVPFSVSSYTEKAIKDKQAQTVGEFLQATDPNVRVSFNSGQFAENYTIRGFQLYSDDVSINGLFGLTPRQLVSTTAISRVDLFKGANAFVNGAPAAGTGVGGGVNVELKHANDKPLTEVTTKVSGSGQVGGQVDIGRRFGSDDQFGIRFNQSVDNGPTAIDKEKRYANTTSVGLDWRADKLRLSADFLYQRAKTDSGRTTFTATGAVPSAPAATSTFAQPWTYSNIEDTVGIIGAEYDFAPGWTAYVKGGAHHGNEWGSFSSPAYNGLTGLSSAYRLNTVLKEDSTSAMGGIRGKFDTGPISHQVNLGGSIVSVDQSAAYTFGYGAYTTTLSNAAAVPYPATTSAGGNMGNPGTTSQVVNRSVSVSDTLGFLHDRVLFTIGARRQELRQDAYGYDGVRSSSYDQAITTPIFGIVFKPTNDWSIYANRTEALVQGGVAGSTTANFGQVFAPYRSKQWELGTKVDMGAYGANFALFQIEQPNAYTDPTTNIYSQSGKQRNRGAEIDLHGEPIKGVRLIAGASYTNAKLLNASVSANDGNTAVGVPSWLANIGVEYDIPHVQGLTMTGQWIYTSRQYLDQANTLSIGAWSRFDVGARYATQVFGKDLTVRATVQNVANRAYWASAYGGYLTLGNPRTFWLSLTTDF
jgi:iron complex outermembrane receptor protein